MEHGVKNSIEGGIKLEQYILRKAVEYDMELLFQLTNEKENCKNSFQSNCIDWNTYQNWFRKQIRAKDKVLYIYCRNLEPIGQIWLEYKENCADIRYSVAKKYCGQGYGERMLLLAEEKVRKEQKEIQCLDAEVKKDNIASRKRLEQLGYESYEVTKYRKKLTEKKKVMINEGGGDRNKKGILILTNNQNSLPLYDWLCKKDYRVYLYSERIYLEQLEHMRVELIVCYNYRYIVKKEIIQAVQGNIINLHISFLPWNRGSNPNFWSFIDNTPKGVTIHYINEELDKGKILLQKEYFFNEANETFASTYEKLNCGIKELFYKNWDKINQKQLTGEVANGIGSYHNQKDLEYIKNRMTFSWDETIISVKQKYKQIFNG